MSDLDDVDVPPGEGQKAVTHTNDMFTAASEGLTRFLAQDTLDHYPGLEWGSRSLKRGGDKKQVHYVELTDPNGLTLRIEVYFK